MERLYFKNLDRWRFVAAFTVICAHYVTVFNLPSSVYEKYLRFILTLDGSGADAGVNFFFVLSGFLITFLLISEKADSGTISVYRFYLKRLLRIWPLYLVSVIIGFTIAPLSSSNYMESASWKLYALFLANFDQIYFWNFSATLNPLLGVHWSVAVEEQYYLLWPWVVLLVSRRFILIVGFIVVFGIYFQGITSLPTHTISCFSDLGMGALAAFCGFRYKEVMQRRLASLDSRIISAIYIVGFLVLLARYQLGLHWPFYEYVARSFNGLFFSFIVIEQCFNPRAAFTWLSSSIFSYLGRISYGLYLLHPLAMFLIIYFLPSEDLFWLKFPLTVLLSILFSMISYHFFEIHFLKLKERLN